MGLSGRVPRRVDAATKSGLLELVDEAVEAGWPVRRAAGPWSCWMNRRAHGSLADRRPGGNPLHGLLADEIEQVVALFHDWGDIDRAHRKLADRGS